MSMNYVLTIEDLKRRCEAYRDERRRTDGQCAGCGHYGLCLLESREMQIEFALHMESHESRFPKLLQCLQGHPNWFRHIPARVYRKMYGMYTKTLGCPFGSDKIVNNLSRIETVYELLSDEASRLCFLNILMYRLTRDRSYALRAYGMEPQYFIESFRGLGTSEVFVDCGAYIGDTFQTYLQYNDPPRAAYLLEPSSTSRAKMEINVEPYRKNTDIQIINKGVYARSGELYLSVGQGMANQLSETPGKGCISIEVTSIDDAISEEVSFIKMDIEGSERDALIGAQRHILSNYPRLAVCVYHRVEDLWEIPLMIRERFPAYTRFRLRHHTPFFTDTILYVSR